MESSQLLARVSTIASNRGAQMALERLGKQFNDIYSETISGEELVWFVSSPMETTVCLVDANTSHTGVLATTFMKFAFPSESQGE